MEIREYYQSKLKKSFLLTISIFVICSVFIFNSQAIAQIQSPPDPPTNLLATGASSIQVNISWTTPSNNGGSITGYEIEYKIGSGDYSVLVANTANTTTSYVHTGLSPNTIYTYRVSAISPTGTSIPSNEATATTMTNYYPSSPTDPPDPPTNLLATAASSTQINIGWTTPSNNGGAITGYKIEYKIGSGDYSVLVANTANTATSYAHNGLTLATTYTYRVSAISPTGTSIPSNEVTATTMTNYFPSSPTDPPNPPINLGAHADSSTQITIGWGIPVSTIGLYTGYKIEYKIGSGDYSVLVANTANTNTSYVHTGLTLGTTYTYRVSTISSTGTSIPSNEASATTLSLSDQSTTTQTQSGFANMFSNPSIMEINGTYSDPANGIQITFPDGWNGNKMQTANLTAIMLTKSHTEFMPSITFEIMDKSTLEKMVGTLQSLGKNLANNAAFKQAMMKSGNGCNVTPSTSITVNGMSGLQYVEQCTSSGQALTIEMTMFETNKNFVSLLLMTADFEKDKGDYTSALNSLQISNTVKVLFADLTTQTPSPSTQPSSSDQSTTTQTPSPSTQPSSHISLTISTDKSSYSLGDTVTTTILFSGINQEQNISVSIKDQTGSNILSKTVTTDSMGAASLQFNLPTSAQSGSYQAVVTSFYDGNNWENISSFDLQQNGSPLSTGSAHTTEQQGNSPLLSTGLGFLDGIMKFFNNLFHW